MQGGGKRASPRGCCASRRLRLPEALRGAPSGGRSERVLGCWGRAASPQPGSRRRREVQAGRHRAGGVRGVPAGKGRPEEFGGHRGGPLSPSCPESCIFLFPPQPLRAALEAARAPSSPLRGPFGGAGGGGAHRPRRPPPSLAGAPGMGSGAVAADPCTRRFSYFTRVICGINIGARGGRFSAVFSVKRRSATSGVKAGERQVGSWGVRVGLGCLDSCSSLLPPSPFSWTWMQFVGI